MLILILPIISGILCQAIKFFIKSNKQKFNHQDLLAYSGMPSGHSAVVISLTTIIGLKQGFNSPIFAFSIIFAIIIIRDALGFRTYLGNHSYVLNMLIKDLDGKLKNKYPHLLEHIGHTPAQVFVGSLIGFIISIIGFYLF